MVEYLKDVQGYVAAHEEALAEVLLKYLGERRDVTIYGETTSDASIRVPTISFAIKDWDPKEVVETVEGQTDFGFRWGHFYSKRLCDDVLKTGENGVIRVSMVSEIGIPQHITCNRQGAYGLDVS